MINKNQALIIVACTMQKQFKPTKKHSLKNVIICTYGKEIVINHYNDNIINFTYNGCKWICKKMSDNKYVII